MIVLMLTPEARRIFAQITMQFVSLGMPIAYSPFVIYAPAMLIGMYLAYRFLYQKTYKFVLSDERLIVRYGVLLRVEDEIELYRVVDVAQTISIVQRILGVGNIVVTSTDRTGSVVMPLISRPSEIRNAIRTEAEKCKNRRGAVRILE
jgi:uncharacterized membrane protein YdbT with pleckstrin-like domain